MHTCQRRSSASKRSLFQSVASNRFFGTMRPRKRSTSSKWTSKGRSARSSPRLTGTHSDRSWCWSKPSRLRSTAPTHEAWEHILLDAEYEFAAFDGINRFYVDRDHHDLIPALAYPISALDRFDSFCRHALVAANEQGESEADDRTRQAAQKAERLGRSLLEAMTSSQG